jgi:hypothetical protein
MYTTQDYPQFRVALEKSAAQLDVAGFTGGADWRQCSFVPPGIQQRRHSSN